jgi:hypothetical protein
MTCSARSFSSAFSARPGPGDRVRFDARPLDANQHLRRRTENRPLPHPHEEHVGGRVDVAERPVDRERLSLDLGIKPLGEHDLVNVAGGDLLLRRPNRRFELIARHVRAHREPRARLLRRLRQARLEFPLQEADLGARELVERFEVVVLAHAGVRDDQNPMPHVVERQHRVEHHEAGRGL